MRKISSLEELKKLASESTVYAFIHLNYGLKSSKDISYDKESDTWEIYNSIDDVEQTLNTKELGECTNIIKAIENGALYQY
jgi:hypothetical protein